jgi:hypothetical protein
MDLEAARQQQAQTAQAVNEACEVLRQARCSGVGDLGAAQAALDAAAARNKEMVAIFNAAVKADREARRARLARKLGPMPTDTTARCHYCGQEIDARAIVGFFNEYQCRQCQ